MPPKTDEIDTVVGPACHPSWATAEETAPPSAAKKGAAKDAAVKKGSKAPKRTSGAGGEANWLSGPWRPLPKDVAIIGLVLVFVGLRWVAQCMQVAEVCTCPGAKSLWRASCKAI